MLICRRYTLPPLINLTRRVVRRDAVATFCAPCTTARVEMVSKGQNTVLASATLRLTNGQSPETKITVPALAGDYEIRFILDGVTEPVTIVKPFTRKKFVWEGNTLGITDEVFPPFTPVKATGREVQVVLRHMTMNSFGLWDKVITEERNILASPMSIRYTTSTGEGKWNKPAVKLEQRTDTTAIYTTSVDSPAVRVTTRSTVEFDGCMKVEMTLAPGKIPRKINKLWVDIPFKDQEVPLFHQIADTLRFNYAGKTPAGEGVIGWISWIERQVFLANLIGIVFYEARAIIFTCTFCRGWHRGASHPGTRGGTDVTGEISRRGNSLYWYC